MVGLRRRAVQIAKSARIEVTEKQTRQGSRTLFKPQKPKPTKKLPASPEVTPQEASTSHSGDLAGTAQDNTDFYDDGFYSVPPNQKKQKRSLL
jgi:hypothetical protein